MSADCEGLQKALLAGEPAFRMRIRKTTETKL